MKHEITPAWMGLEDASKWSGLSTRVLESLIKDKLILSSNCKMPGNSRGRRLINVESLDAYIRAGVALPPAEIAMNVNRLGVENGESAEGRRESAIGKLEQALSLIESARDDMGDLEGKGYQQRCDELEFLSKRAVLFLGRIRALKPPTGMFRP